MATAIITSQTALPVSHTYTSMSDGTGESLLQLAVISGSNSLILLKSPIKANWSE